jgi:hypothetical protein
MQMRIIWDNPRALQCNISTNDHICHIHQENKTGIQWGSISATITVIFLFVQSVNYTTTVNTEEQKDLSKLGL